MNRTLTLVLIGIMTLVSFYTVEAQINSKDVTKKNLLTTWKVLLTITGDGATFIRTFGGDPNATDEFDTGLDVPAAPPGIGYYAYFEIIQFPNYLDTDIRAWISPYKTDIDWTLKVINAAGKTTTMSWDPANLPSEGTFTLEGANGSLDMRIHSSVTFSGDRIATIMYRESSSITITSPNGAELWIVAGSYDITWTSKNFTDPVKIEYSIDGGLTWLSPPIAANTPNDGSYSWTIPNTPSNNCKVRVSDAVDGTPSDVSDEPFTIVAEGILGDVNNDDNANSTDALIVLSCDVGINVSQFCPMNCGDVNGDGLINSTDALIILSYDVGISVPFPVGQPGCPANVTPCPGCYP